MSSVPRLLFLLLQLSAHVAPAVRNAAASGDKHRHWQDNRPAAAASAHANVNPYDDFASFDCQLRKLALDFALELQPHRGRHEVQAIADALNGAAFAECRNLSIPAGVPPPSPPAFPLPSGAGVVFVAVDGSDAADGTIRRPLKTLSTAVAKVRPGGASIVLRQGTHYLSSTLELGARHSGLRIVNYPGEQAFVSGGVGVSAQDLLWTPTLANPRVVRADLRSVKGLPQQIQGLRIDGARAIRARYPNADPELGFGPGLRIGGGKNKGPNGTGFLPVSPPGPLTVINPATPNRSAAGAVGVYTRYNFGIGGPCTHFTPPAGYWCGTATGGGGGSQYSGVPTGITVGNHLQEVLPRFPWSNPAGAIVDMFSNAQMWSNWMFEVGHINETTVFFEKGGFQGARGCGNHKGQTSGCGYQFYVENVMDELDAPNEWFFNESTRMLYYHLPNSTSVADLASLHFEVTNLKHLIRISGNLSAPARNITLQGLGLKDSAYTYMDGHEMVSGGDWTLPRSGAVFIEGAEGVSIEDCNFTRLDSNALTLSGYTRNVSILRNSFTLIGGNTISLMGKTTMPDADPRLQGIFGWDGREGNQPRFTTVAGNIAHSLGIWEKQSSFFFQAKSCQNNISGNIVFGDPRAGVNFNDGFGGGSHLSRNLMFNTCDETSQGVFNSWDRQAYFTDIDPVLGTKQWDEISHNLMINSHTLDSRGDHSAMEAIDNDDGSSYYRTHDNVFAYNHGGMKNDFDGHDNVHFNNLFCYISGPAVDITAHMLPGHEDLFFNNTVVGTGKAYDLIARNTTAPPLVYDNKIFTQNGVATAARMPLSNGTTVALWPKDAVLIGWAKERLGMR